MSTKEEFVRYIRKTGTSLGINIPLEVIKILELRENEIVRVTVETLKQRKSKISVDLKTKFSNGEISPAALRRGGSGHGYFKQRHRDGVKKSIRDDRRNYWHVFKFMERSHSPA